MSIQAPYGSWKSPLTSKIACDSSVLINGIYVDAKNPDTLYWSELHPHKEGRTVIFSKNVYNIHGDTQQWTPEEYSAVSTVHEYGGGAFFVNEGNVYFMNSKDNRIYCQVTPEREPRPVTKREDALHRYADGDWIHGSDFFVAVREDHSQAKRTEAENLIVCINQKNGEELVVASGYDFYSTPRLSKDGKKLVWVQWNHPNMPWDNTELWVCDVAAKGDSIIFTNRRKFAGTQGVNYMEPKWTCDHRLMYISDQTGYWNLYLADNLSNGDSARNVLQRDVELGQPAWRFSNNFYSPHPSSEDIVAVLYGGKPSILNISTGEITEINIGDAVIRSCLFQPIKGGYIYMNAVYPVEPASILVYNMLTEAVDKFHQTGKLSVDPGYLSQPELIKFKVKSSDNMIAHAYGYYYRPTNKDYSAPKGSLPPLIVKIHGGPTSSANQGMAGVAMGKQYFTSRGFAVLDLDHRGSSSYGTSYRNALQNKWGVYDVEDACAGALYLAEELELVDRNKLVVSGISAGGFTTMATLTFSNVFACGASICGVSDIPLFIEKTHKLQARYMDNIVGDYPAKVDRSPMNHLESFNTPCAFFHGDQDTIASPYHSIVMFEELKRKGVKCSYVSFPDEGHGFKKLENKQKALDGEYYFYSVVLGFSPADQGIEIPVECIFD